MIRIADAAILIATSIFRRAAGCVTLPRMRASFLKCLLLFILGATLLASPSAQLTSARAQTPTMVDLELVLAVDVSLSMDIDEQRLQRDGYITALRDPEVQKAIRSGPYGRIAVTYMEWAGPNVQSVVVPWTIVDSPASANAFADRLQAADISRARMTSISAALHFSKDLLGTSGVRGIRRVVDVSGDGPNNAGLPITPVRDELVAAGIVINGLPVVLKGNRSTGMFDLEDLDRYYTDCVIGGTGAFVIPVREPGEFKTATRRKLLLEISGLEPPARVLPAQNVESADCSVGERQWRRYLDGVPN